MNYLTGRPDHIEDYLVKVRTGQWFGWSDSSNKIYANLVVHDGGSKPTESDVNDGLKAMQDAFDAKDYSRKRVKEYPSLGEFADAMYWNSKGDSTKLEAYYAACEKVKTDNPKPS